MNLSANRRQVLYGAAAVALAGASGVRAAEPGAPVARVAPVVDDYFGTKLTDPYRWMENPKDPDWLPFLKGQDAHARQVLAAIPGRDALLAKIRAVSGDTAITNEVQTGGDRLFYEQRPAGADNYKLFVRDGAGAPRVLIDPTTMKIGDAHVSLDWWSISDDGAWIAYGLSPAGSEASVLQVMNVGSGEVLPERIAKTDSAQPSWLPDGSGFFYTQFTGELRTPGYYLDGQVRFHKLRTDPAGDPVVLKRGLVANIPMESNQTPFLFVHKEGGVVLAAVTDIRPEVAIWTAKLADAAAGKPDWKPLCGFDAAVTAAVCMGGDLYLLSSKGAIRGQVLKTPASAPDFASAQVAVPQSAIVLESLAATRSAVLVTTMDGGIQRIRRIGKDGAVSDVALPYEGSVRSVYASADREDAYLELTGWLQPRAMWRYDPAGSVADAGLAPKSTLDLSAYEASRTFATAKDGVRIPISVIARKGFPRNGANPTLVNGYGAYQLSSSPSFSAGLLPFLDAGGVFAVAHVRGGGEYGREWHYAGMKTTKPNTWRDLIACCEELIATKVTSPAHLAITGTSAGGITVGRAMTERPDLFAAVISNVGWSNPLRYVAEQDGFGEIAEWGSIEDERGFHGLLAMDSYQSVRDGVAYPATLLITGASDPRVAPFHVAKMTARLQAASSSGKPVILRVDFDAGHGIGSTRTQADALAADMYAFVLWRTGAKGFA